MSSSDNPARATNSHQILTLGHSTHALEHFFSLLEQHKITAIADVRSSPYSGMNPQFNREPLTQSLKDAGIAYVFLGEELGARSDDPACYDDRKVNYDRLAETNAFTSGLQRVLDGSNTYKLAMMCAEKEPLDCHRTILVSRHLVASGAEVLHIHADGSIESHDHAVSRLRKQLRLSDAELFRTTGEIDAEAYERQGNRIAYVIPEESREAAGADSEAQE